MPISTNSKPLTDLRRLLTLIYGPPKTGKSTLASQYPEALFLATEAGLNLLSVNHWSYADHTAEKPNYVIKTWEDLLAATAESIISGYKTIVLDTVGNACLLCEEYVCRKNGEDHKNAGKLAFGVGTTLVANELKRYFTKLSSNGIGTLLIAHSMQRAVTTRAGEVQKTVPFIPCDNKNFEIYNMILGSADMILFMDQEADGSRLIRTKPHPTYDAGDRSGRLTETIKLPSENMGAGSFDALYESFYGKKPAKKKIEEPKEVFKDAGIAKV